MSNLIKRLPATLMAVLCVALVTYLYLEKKSSRDSFSNTVVATPTNTSNSTSTSKAVYNVQQPGSPLELTGKEIVDGEVQTNLDPKTSKSSFTVTALGDVILGRTVLKKMQAANDYTAPFKAMASEIKKADLTLADLEVSLSDNVEHPLEGMSFMVPSKAVEGLKFGGIDLVSLSNNHSYNGGSVGFKDTMQTLDEAGIGYFGGGENLEKARAPKIVNIEGNNIALLGYSSIVGSVSATSTKNGMATFSCAPWGELDQAEIDQMKEEVAEAKKKSDLVFIYMHWSAEYTHKQNDDQVNIAHQLIDAGADLIIGTHPHWVQGIEWYNGKLITYSLGNFVFDQEWSTETKQGTYLNLTFSDKKLIKASLEPYQIEDYNQPRPVSKEIQDKILKDVFDNSIWPK